MHLMRVILTQSSGIFFSVFILAGTASAQVSLTSPASAELVGANISMPGTGYPAGAISANWVSITVTPSPGAGSPVSFAPTTVSGSGSIRTLIFKLPAALSANQPYTAAVCVSGQTTSYVAFTTSACANITVNPAASISNVSPGAGQIGNSVRVTIAGLYSHFAQTTSVVSVGGTGVTVSGVAITAGSTTQLSATFTIAANAPVGPRTVTVTSGSEVATLAASFVVAPNSGLTLSTINPNSAAQGVSPGVEIQAINSHFAQGVTTANFGSGVTITGIAVNSPTDMTVWLWIDPLAPAGGRTVTVVTGSEFAVATNGFTVTPSGASIVGVAPPTPVPPGSNATLTLTGVGTHWVSPATSVSFGGGIISGAVTVSSYTSLTVSISVGAQVGAGTYGVTTATNGEIAMLNSAVTVPASTPLISGVAPSTGVQGATFDVFVSGTNTNFTTGGISANFGPLIAINSVSPTNANTVDINVSISYLAATGGREVNLTSNGTLFSFNFTVGPDSSSVINVTPNSATQQSSAALQVTGSNTHWSQGTTAASLGDGNIGINRVIVNSPTTAEVDITISAQASLGLHAVSMTTGGEASLSSQSQPAGSWTYRNNEKGEHGSILGGLLYAPLENNADNSGSGFGVIDPATGVLQQFISVPTNCLEAAPAMDIRGYLHVYSCSSSQGASGGFLAKIDLSTGTVVKTLTIPTGQVDWEKVAYDPVNDILLQAMSGVGLRAVRTTDYSTAWTNTDVTTTAGGYACGACETGPVLINGQYAYWQDFVGKLFKIDLATGATVASQAAFVSGYVGVYANMSFDQVNSRIFLTTAANTVYAVNALDLSLIWTHTVDDSSWYFFRGGAYHNNVYYVTDRQKSSPYGSKIYALNAATGNVLWTNTTAINAGAEISSLLVDDTYAYAGTYDYTTFNYNYILVVNLSDGTLEESIPLVHGVSSGIPTVYAGRIIAGLWDTFGYQAVQVRAGGGTGDWYYKADTNMTGYAGPFMSGALSPVNSGFTVLPLMQ